MKATDFYSAAYILQEYAKDIDNSTYHNQIAKDVERNFDDLLDYFPNIRSLRLYRGYTFKASQYSFFVKIFKEVLDNTLTLSRVTSWSSKKSVALSFFNGPFSKRDDYALLLATTVKPNTCIDVEACEPYTFDKDNAIKDEDEFILNKTKLTKVDLLAAFSRKDKLVYYNDKRLLSSELTDQAWKNKLTTNLSEFLKLVL